MADETVDAVDSSDQGEVAQPGGEAQVAEPGQNPGDMFEIVVDGQKEVVDRATAIRWAQLGKAGHVRLQKAAELTKAAKQFEDQFGKDPVAAMVAKFGPEKTKEMLEDRLYDMYERAKESPEKREAREAKEELERLRAEKQKLEDERETARQEALEKHFAEKWNREFTDAIKETGMDHTAENVARMAELGLLALENELDVDPADIARMVKHENETRLRKLATSLSPEQLIAYLGDEAIDKIRKANLTKLKSSPVQRRPGTAPKARSAKAPETKELSPDERWEMYKNRLPKEG